MDRSSIEKLVTQITEEVLAKLQNNFDLHSTNGSQSAPIKKRIVTEADVKEMLQQGALTLYLSEKAILTPSAKDIIRQKNLRIVHENSPVTSGVKSRKVAVLAPHCSEKAEHSYEEILTESGYQPEIQKLSAKTTTVIEKKAMELVSQVATGDLQYAIILDVNIFSQCAQANKIKGVKAVICWNARSAEESVKSFSPNVLFVHNELLEFKTICEIIKAWLLRNGHKNESAQKAIQA